LFLLTVISLSSGNNTHVASKTSKYRNALSDIADEKVVISVARNVSGRRLVSSHQLCCMMDMQVTDG
jgi:hypothetical protein